MSEMTLQQAAWLVESAEADAWSDYYTCAPVEFARQYRVGVRRLSAAWVTMMAGMPSWFFNRINGLGLGGAATEPALDEAIGVLRSAGCKEYAVQLSPAAQPPELPDWLKARGLRRGSNWAKMVRRNEPASTVHSDLRIESVGPEWIDPFARIMLETFEMSPVLQPMMSCQLGKPGWHNYLGFDGDRPVATASMFISGEVAWLGMGSTLASHRGRGAQSAMFARRIEDGRRAGCKWFVTETGEDTPESPNPSYRNMLRAGFKLVYMRPNFIGSLD